MRMLRYLLALLAAALISATPAAAHEVRPAYLEIREIAPGEYDLLWKTPAKGDMRLSLDVSLPVVCTSLTVPRTVLAGGAVIARWRESCPGGLAGAEVGVSGLRATLTDAIVRFEPLEGGDATLLLSPDAPAAVIPERQSWSSVLADYVALGFEHILLGVDHLAFVLALILLVGNPGRLLGAVTAFTIAHSLTLAATTFGWVQLASAPVEASIALSIAFVAAEALRVRAGGQSLTSRWPWTASLAFGLLHGFGFAGALREIGMPSDAALLALFAFNIGVEAGQIAFIAAVLALGLIWRRLRVPAPDWAPAAPAYIIGVVGCFWFIERTFTILAGGA